MANKSLLNKDLADLNNDGKLSSYEKRRGMAIEESMQEREPYKLGKLVSKLTKKIKPFNKKDKIEEPTRKNIDFFKDEDASLYRGTTDTKEYYLINDELNDVMNDIKYYEDLKDFAKKTNQEFNSKFLDKYNLFDDIDELKTNLSNLKKAKRKLRGKKSYNNSLLTSDNYREPYKLGKLVNKALKELQQEHKKFVKEAFPMEKNVPAPDYLNFKGEMIEPNEADLLYKFLRDKVRNVDTTVSPMSSKNKLALNEQLALEELKIISQSKNPEKSKLFGIFLDDRTKSIDDFIQKNLDDLMELDLDEAENLMLLQELEPVSRAINNQGGLLASDDYRMGFAEGQNDAEMQNYRVILAGLRQLPENELPQVLALAQEGKSLPEQYMVEEKAGVVMNPIDAQKNHPDLFMKALNFLQEPREQQNEGGEMEMLPDEEMEQNFIDFVVDEALSDEEKSMLEEQLEANPELSVLFDKVIERASEFTGAGPVDGPGTGTSDDIPARLSDGEFVFTAKAVEQIGADNLMKMMKDAEAAYDAGGERKGYANGEEVIQDEDINKGIKKVEVEYSVQQQPTSTESLFGQPLYEEDESSKKNKELMRVNPTRHVYS